MTNSYNFFNLRAFSEADQPYACNDWVVFQEKAYKSKKPENNRHPHDSDYWYEIGLVSGLLDHLLQDNRAIDLSVAFYPECSNGCVAMFDKGGCVIDKVPVLNTDGTQKKDDCGQLVFELMIFTSLVDCNTDAPQEGASKDEITWDGGYTVCAYLNRPVAYTQDGNKPENWLKPEAPQNLKCVLDCSAPDGETIELAEQGEAGTHSSMEGRKLRARHDNESIVTTPEKGLEVAVIGKTVNGEPVDVREDPCLVTCEDMGNGLWHNPETGEFEVKAADNSITVDSDGVRVNISDGLELTDDGVKVKAADDSIEVTPEGVQVGIIGTDIAGQSVDVQKDPCLVTCENVKNEDFYVKDGQLKVNFPCHPLRYGTGYREHCDGRVEMWGRAIVGVGSEDRAVAAKLPVLLNGPITYGNTHISITDVGWAANPGQHLDDLPGDYPNDPSTDKLDQTDMGWGPSNANPTGEFVIWAYQHEQSGSAAIELVSWHLVTERGIA